MSDLNRYNEALRMLGQTRLDTLTDDRPARYALDNAWSDSLADVLEEGAWNFAKRVVKIDADTAITTVFGYANTFSKPDDWVSTLAISADEMFAVPLNQFEDNSDNWVAAVDPIYVTYVSNGALYGGNLGRWTRKALKALSAQLALDTCTIITQGKGDREELFSLRKKYMSDAKSKDGLNEPTRFPPSGRLVTARRGNLVDTSSRRR